jgi:hypothetical protein
MGLDSCSKTLDCFSDGWSDDVEKEELAKHRIPDAP